MSDKILQVETLVEVGIELAATELANKTSEDQGLFLNVFFRELAKACASNGTSSQAKTDYQLNYISDELEFEAECGIRTMAENLIQREKEGRSKVSPPAPDGEVPY